MGWIEWLASPLKGEHSEKVPFICKFYFAVVGISGVIVFDISM